MENAPGRIYASSNLNNRNEICSKNKFFSNIKNEKFTG
jgi:hypothetical protein